MRIAFLVNRDVESCLALNLLLPALREHALSVFLSERVGGAAPAGAAANPAPAAMLGQLGFIEQDLWNRVVFPRLDAAPDAGGFLSFDGLGRRLGVPVRPLASARTPEGLAALAAVQADLFVSIRFGRILGDEAIRLPRLGVLNLHSGLLPAYRGVLATFRGLMNGDRRIGCTLHRIDEPSIDTGPVLGIREVAVDPSRSLLWHILALYPPGAEMILEAIARLAAGEALRGQPQPAGGAYFSFPVDEDLVRFTAAGWRLFDRADVAALLARFGL